MTYEHVSARADPLPYTKFVVFLGLRYPPVSLSLSVALSSLASPSSGEKQGKQNRRLRRRGRGEGIWEEGEGRCCRMQLRRRRRRRWGEHWRRRRCYGSGIPPRCPTGWSTTTTSYSSSWSSLSSPSLLPSSSSRGSGPSTITSSSRKHDCLRPSSADATLTFCGCLFSLLVPYSFYPSPWSRYGPPLVRLVIFILARLTTGWSDASVVMLLCFPLFDDSREEI